MPTQTTPRGLGKACCPVYATEETWSLIERFPLADRHVIEHRRPFRIGRISFETFPVEHSLLTVGYRVTEGRVAFFYVPDDLGLQQIAMLS